MRFVILLLGLSFLVACDDDKSGSGSDAGGDAGDSGGGDASQDGGDGGGGGGDELEACLTGFESRVDTQVVRFASDDGSIHLGVVSGQPEDTCMPPDECACNGGSCSVYELIRFGIERDGVVVCIDDLDDLEYQGGQHSWGDTATASTATTRYEVKMIFSFETNTFTDTLELFDIGEDTPSEDAINLVAEDCYSVPPGEGSGCCDRCQTRPRSDL